MKQKRLSKSETETKDEYLLRGFKVVKIVSPNFFVYKESEKDGMFVYVKPQGSRLTGAQQRSIADLKKAGFKVEVTIATLAGEIIRLDKELDKVSVPSKRMFREPDLNLQLDQLKPSKFSSPLVAQKHLHQMNIDRVYDPDKHRMTPEEKEQMEREEWANQRQGREIEDILNQLDQKVSSNQSAITPAITPVIATEEELDLTKH